MKLFFWICLSSMIPGLLIRIPFSGGGILLMDILLPLFVGTYLLNKIFIERKLPSAYFLIPGFSFLAVAFFSWIFNAWNLDLSQQILSFSYLVRFFCFLMIGCFVKENYAQNINALFPKLALIIFLIICSGFLQFYLIPDISKYSTLGGFDPHIGRLLGTWMDPNFVAGMLSFFIPFTLAYIYNLKSKKYRWWIFLILCSYAGFLTFSRSGYLAIIAGVSFFFFWKDIRVIFLGIIIALSLLSTSPRAQERVIQMKDTISSLIFQNTETIDPTANLRIQSWIGSLSLWEQKPWFGVGYNTYRFRASQAGIVDENNFSSGGSDSTLLTILVTTGVFGLAAFFWFFVSLWWYNFKWYLKEKNVITLGVSAGMIGILVHSVFVNSLLFPLIFAPIMAIIGSLVNTNKSLTK